MYHGQDNSNEARVSHEVRMLGSFEFDDLVRLQDNQPTQCVGVVYPFVWGHIAIHFECSAKSSGKIISD